MYGLQYTGWGKVFFYKLSAHGGEEGAAQHVPERNQYQYADRQQAWRQEKSRCDTVQFRFHGGLSVITFLVPFPQDHTAFPFHPNLPLA